MLKPRRRLLTRLIPLAAGAALALAALAGAAPAVASPAARSAPIAHVQLAKPDWTSGCTGVICKYADGYGFFASGNTHGGAVVTCNTPNCGTNYTWTNYEDNIWGYLCTSTLCWTWDPSTATVVMEGYSAGDHEQLWEEVPYDGVQAIKNYYAGTTDNLWGADEDGDALSIRDVDSINTEWLFFS
jgi:hypothetical protein